MQLHDSLSGPREHRIGESGNAAYPVLEKPLRLFLGRHENSADALWAVDRINDAVAARENNGPVRLWLEHMMPSGMPFAVLAPADLKDTFLREEDIPIIERVIQEPIIDQLAGAEVPEDLLVLLQRIYQRHQAADAPGCTQPGPNLQAHIQRGMPSREVLGPASVPDWELEILATAQKLWEMKIEIRNDLEIPPFESYIPHVRNNACKNKALMELADGNLEESLSLLARSRNYSLEALELRDLAFTGRLVEAVERDPSELQMVTRGINHSEAMRRYLERTSISFELHLQPEPVLRDEPGRFDIMPDGVDPFRAETFPEDYREGLMRQIFSFLVSRAVVMPRQPDSLTCARIFSCAERKSNKDISGWFSDVCASPRGKILALAADAVDFMAQEMTEAEVSWYVSFLKG